MRHNESNEKSLAQRKAHYEREDVNGKLVINLRDASHMMRGLYEGRGSQRRILIVLDETGTITQRELTERLGIQPGSASEVISKLESAGLVMRSPSETDRRTADISLTEKGKEQAEEAKRQRFQRHKEMFSVLSDEEKSRLLVLLERINQDWETRYAQREAPCHGHHHHDHHHHGSHDHHGEHGGEDGERRGCNHDCANCPHPCPKARTRLEGSR